MYPRIQLDIHTVFVLPSPYIERLAVMEERSDIRKRIYQAYNENSHGRDDWHPTVYKEIRSVISREIYAVLTSENLTEEDLREISELLASLITEEKRSSATRHLPVHDAD
jgi:hypothetical protein